MQAHLRATYADTQPKLL